MFSISSIAKGIGQVFGEAAHQADKLYEGTKQLADDSWEDIKAVPDALKEGYDEELFSSDAQVAPKEAEIPSTIEVVDNGDNKESTIVDSEVITTEQKPKFV